jgi:RNA polymerase sigma factor (TIGR02999 family)
MSTDSSHSSHSTQSSLTLLLNQWRQGDGRALDRVLEQAFHELQQMANRRMRQNESLTLSPTDLLNEAVIRLMESETDFKNRAHFFGVVSLHMRSVLVDHARARLAAKRGGAVTHFTLTSANAGEDGIALELISLDEALAELDTLDPRGAQILHLTYFAGLDREAIANVINVSLSTVDRELRFARSWLAERLGYPIP